MNTNIKTNTVENVHSVLSALNHGRILEALDAFDDQFTFIDKALGLEFTDKERLTEFFQKLGEDFPDTVVEVISTFESEDQVIAEWKINANRKIAYLGQQQQIPISFQGISVVRMENGRITHWSDYYDSNKSWRCSLAAFFTDWIEI